MPEQQGQSKATRNVIILAVIVVTVAVVSPGTVGTVQNAVGRRWQEYQEHAERARGEAEADRRLKVSAQALEAELSGINVRGDAEMLRLDVANVRDRAQSLRQRFLAVQDRAEPVYGGRTDYDGALYASLKQYGPAQIDRLNEYLDLLDKAEKGAGAAKDPTEFVPLMRKISRYNREEFVRQHMANVYVSRLELQFGGKPGSGVRP